MPIINLEQGSPGWLSYRKGKVMASEISIVLGNNPWKTPLQLWKEKLDIEKASLPNEAMKHGIKLEPEARLKAIEKIKLSFTPQVEEDSERHWMAASLDGITECGEFILEIKCPLRPGLHFSHMQGQIPIYYKDQIQQQLLITGAEIAFYCTYYPHDKENPICISEIKPDEEKQSEIIEKGREFYIQMCTMQPPQEWQFKERK